MPISNQGTGNTGNKMANTDPETNDLYWKANLRLLGLLLAVWFVVSFGFGIFFRDFLDQWSLGGAPLGFWFAQQGSIYVFVVLIFVYSFLMNRLERRFDTSKNSSDE